MTIRVLPPAVADAIAAGEVVERPASVVKELVENALDAGARRIVVEVDGAGGKRIVVTDDGAGIAADELALAFTRHATSKLFAATDLAAVRSLGFRGEALASIAAVSRVRCQSTTAGAARGAAVVITHGSLGAVEVAAPAGGTRVEVTALFENTPARRAFLKRPATETGAIVRAVTALALCHPGVAVILTVDGRQALSLGASQELEERFRAVHRGVAELLAVSGARSETRVDGVIGAPVELRRSREQLYLAVNGRPVVSRSLAFAVEQAYRGLIEPGRFPIGALSISTPAELVDVNVHPTKREVRFRDERSVFRSLQEACLGALSGSAVYAGAGLLRRDAGGIGEDQETAVVADKSAGSGVTLQVARGEGLPAGSSSTGLWDGVEATSSQLTLAEPAPADSTAPRPLLRGPFRLVGQVLDSYVVAEGPAGLVLVDQHAAHERIIFNQLVATREGRTGDSPHQEMLVPALLHLTPVQATVLAEVRADLVAAGLVVEDFGAGGARLVAHDPRLAVRQLDRLAIDVLDTLVAEDRDVDLERRLERTTYTVACHAAVKFGQRLSREEMEALLRALEVADPGISCPHGRPTIIEISEAQLRREFRRS